MTRVRVYSTGGTSSASTTSTGCRSLTRAAACFALSPADGRSPEHPSLKQVCPDRNRRRRHHRQWQHLRPCRPRRRIHRPSQSQRQDALSEAVGSVVRYLQIFQRGACVAGRGQHGLRQRRQRCGSRPRTREFHHFDLQVVCSDRARAVRTAFRVVQHVQPLEPNSLNTNYSSPERRVQHRSQPGQYLWAGHWHL